MDGIIARVKAILLSPKTEWLVIKNEMTTSKLIMKKYLAPLLLVPTGALFIGHVFVGSPIIGRTNFFSGLIWAVVMYLLSIVGIYVGAYVVNMLAPYFDGKQDELSAFKVVVYSGTAYFVAGIFYLVPALSILTILGLYGIYLLYLGLPVMMECPKDKAILYTIATVALMVVIAILINFISALVLCG
jgi:xanthosine utilization system XapX-like protein